MTSSRIRKIAKHERQCSKAAENTKESCAFVSSCWPGFDGISTDEHIVRQANHKVKGR